MTELASLLKKLIAREGGFADHPADRGGATNWGITSAVARQNGYVGEMRDLSRTEAERIYRSVYWEKPGYSALEALAPSLAAELFDAGVNTGPQTATRFLQRALNALNRNGHDYADLTVDGECGSVTREALSRFLAKRGAPGEAVLVKAVQALRGAHYITLAENRSANEAFVYGWLNNRIG
jgi:lysozyme family protein